MICQVTPQTRANDSLQASFSVAPPQRQTTLPAGLIQCWAHPIGKRLSLQASFSVRDTPKANNSPCSPHSVLGHPKSKQLSLQASFSVGATQGQTTLLQSSFCVGLTPRANDSPCRPHSVLGPPQSLMYSTSCLCRFDPAPGQCHHSASSLDLDNNLTTKPISISSNMSLSCVFMTQYHNSTPVSTPSRLVYYHKSHIVHHYFCLLSHFSNILIFMQSFFIDPFGFRGRRYNKSSITNCYILFNART